MWQWQVPLLPSLHGPPNNLMRQVVPMLAWPRVRLARRNASDSNRVILHAELLPRLFIAASPTSTSRSSSFILCVDSSRSGVACTTCSPSPARAMVVCVLACLRACVLACLRACVLACLRACVLACLRACVLACLRACVLACLRACVLACLRACVLACLRACVLACLRACVLACLRACVLACLPQFKDRVPASVSIVSVVQAAHASTLRFGSE